MANVLLPTGSLPREIANDVWKKAGSDSVVAGLSQSRPLVFGETNFMTFTKSPAAEIVAEGAQKSDGGATFGVKTAKPIKVHVGQAFSTEFVLANPAGVLAQLGEELAAAVARQIDLAVLHGRNAKSGAAVAGLEFLNQTTNRVEMAAGSKGEEDLFAAGGLVLADRHATNGVALDPRLVGVLANARDTSGRRLNDNIGIGGTIDSYAGLRAASSFTVGGDVDGSADTKVRAVVGDWNALKWGYMDGIKLERIEYGDPFGTGDLKRQNMVGFRAEAFFGYAIMDLDAFAVVEDAVA